MTLKTIKTGAQPNDGTGDNLRTGAQIINENFAELDQRAARASAQLSSIETGATKNRSDAELLTRANHTGAQPASTISDFSQAVKALLKQTGMGDQVKQIPESALSGLTVNSLLYVVSGGLNVLPYAQSTYVIHMSHENPAYAVQIAMPEPNGKLYSRLKLNGTWLAWQATVNAGEFGIGGETPAPGGTSMDARNATGIYGWAPAFTGAPSTIASGEYVMLQGSIGAQRATQLALSHDSDEMWFRRDTGGWNPWKKVPLENTVFPANDGGKVTDLNTVQSRSVIWADQTVKNTPLLGDWYVETFGIQGATPGSYVMQRATLLTSYAPVYIRRRVNSDWEPWRQQEGVSAPRINDMNVFTSGGTYRVDSSTANSPVSGIFATCTIVMYDPTNWTQNVISTDGSVQWTRGCVNGGLRAWIRQTPEYVNNGNGSAIKFPDGTMISYFAAATRNACNVPTGNIFASDQRMFNFPVPFVAEPIVTWSSSSSSNGVCWANCEWSSSTQTAGRLNSGYLNVDGYLRYIAIGRWK